MSSLGKMGGTQQSFFDTMGLLPESQSCHPNQKQLYVVLPFYARGGQV